MQRRDLAVGAADSHMKSFHNLASSDRKVICAHGNVPLVDILLRARIR